MESNIKESGLALSKVLEMANKGRDLVDRPNRVYGIFMDLYPGKYPDPQKMIKKGLDSGIYASIYAAKDKKTEAQKCIHKLMESDFMAEYQIKQIIAILLIALDPSAKNITEVEKFVGVNPNQPSAPQKQVSNQPKKGGVTAAPAPAPEKSTPQTEPLLKRMFMFLEDKDWTAAAQYSDRVLDLDPECSRAYVGKLMAELKLSKESMLGDSSTPQIGIRDTFKKACRFASPQELTALKEFEHRNAYEHGKQVMNRATTEKNFKDASTWFKLYPSYKDSQKLYNDCVTKAETARKEEIYKKALALPLEQQPAAFGSIPGYRDADRLKKEAQNKIEQIRIQRQQQLEADRRREQQFRNKEIRKKAIATPLCILAMIVAVLVDYGFTTYWKYYPGIYRFLWLPLISIALLGGVTLISSILSDKNFIAGATVISIIWRVIAGIWGVVRGITLIGAHFGVAGGFWGYVWAILTFLVVFAFNIVGPCIAVFVGVDDL